MQDSNDDWLREAKTMEKVYKNTYFNISADHSKDATGGCFTERLAYKVHPCRYEAPRIGCVNFTAPRTFLKGLDQSALSERAWVVQERFISPRVLHFTADQLFWECAELFACETFAEGVPNVYDEEWSWHYRANASLAPIHQRDKPNHYEMWDRICVDYSRGKLTELSDKLIAFSGIARVFQSRLSQDTYLAGIWKGNLVSGLRWNVSYEMPIQANGPKEDGAMPFSTASPTSTFRAPSWSWLSTDRPIVWSRWSGHAIVRVLEATIDLVNDGDPSDEMRRGSITVCGRLRSAGWKQQDGRDLIVLDGKHGGQLHERASSKHPEPDELSIQRDSRSIFPVNEVFCLLVTWNPPDRDYDGRIDGLVLRSTEVKDTYQRLGTFYACGLIPCMALKYKLRPLAQEMDCPWDKFRLSRAKKILNWFKKRIRGKFLGSSVGSDGSVENDAEARPANAYSGDASYDETLFEKLEECTITLI